MKEARRAVDFARAARVDGGFGWLDGAGKVDANHGVPLWITARMTYVFSLGVLLDVPDCQPLVQHGVAALSGPFHDDVFGGWRDLPVADGPGATGKSAYAHAFVLLASSAASMAGDRGAAGLLDRATRVVDEHFWDDDAGLCIESWDGGWTAPEPYRGANANMHMVEAFQTVADATGEELWRHRALRIAEQLIDVHARQNDWRLPEHFDSSWRVQPDYNRDAPRDRFRPYGVTPGHAAEWSRLLLQLHTSCPAATWLVPAAAGLFDRAVADGWDVERGGFVYTTDMAGVPVVEDRFHWVVCEMIAAASALHSVTGEPRFGEWYWRIWDYAFTYLVDPERGLWRHELDADNRPASGTWPGRPDAYHVLTALLGPRLPVASSLTAAVLAARI